jgi:pimeloyl-ACP methyl ester carboxylesterase
MSNDFNLDGGPGGTRLRQASITVEAPGWRGKVRLRDPNPSLSRSSSDWDRLPEAAFDNAEVSTVAELEIEAQPVASAAATRGAEEASEIRVILDTPRSEREYALLQTDPSGLRHWVFPSSRTTEAGLTFELSSPSPPEQAAGDADRRGPIVKTMKIVARIVSWVTSGITGDVARDIAAKWEGRRRPYSLSQVAADGSETDPDWTIFASGPTLLLVHGTFSTSRAGFSGLYNTDEFSALLAHYGGRCLAFGHPSLGASVSENVEKFGSALPRGLVLDVDILCHSRGGLVARAIVAAVIAKKLSLRVGKLVMVASPNRGTPLVDATHWIDFIDRYTNLIAELPDTASTVTFEGVLCLVKIIGSGAVKGLPGLAAMEAKSPQLSTLAAEMLGAIRLYAFVADFSPSAGSPLLGLIRKAGDIAVDDFFGEPNDLVVPTSGCYDLEDADGFPLQAERVHRSSGGSINHLNFFDAPDIRAALKGILTAS